MNLDKIKAEIEDREPLPSHAQCEGCGLFDVDNEDVRRILLSRGWELKQIIATAGCRCGLRKYGEAVEARQRRMDANLPNYENPKTFDGFRVTSDNKWANAAVSEFTRGGATKLLTIEGEMGSGKSHLLEAAARRFLEASATVHYNTAAGMINQIRAVYRPDSPDSVQGMLDWFKSFSVLVIDELCGDENITNNARGWLFEIIDERYRNHRRLLMATNKTRDEVAERLGDRIASRLWAHNEPHVKHVMSNASDYRMIRA